MYAFFTRYEGFREMGIKELSKICKQIRNQWEVEHIAIVHKVGRCLIGEVVGAHHICSSSLIFIIIRHSHHIHKLDFQASVIIAVSSAHRKEAIEASHFAIDTLKATVPIWKKVCLLACVYVCNEEKRSVYCIF